MKVQGTIERVYNPATGNKQDGTQWVRQEFIIVLDGGGNYPDRMVVAAFGERVADVQRLTVGQHVTALIDFKVNERDGRCFNNLNLYKFEEEATAPQPTATPQQQTPFVNNPQPQTPAPAIPKQDDGLPF